MTEMSMAAEPTLHRDGRDLTYLIELAVGLGCIVAAVPTMRSPARQWLGAILLIAGAAAVTHAVVRLLA
jgi:hypothetical protein